MPDIVLSGECGNAPKSQFVEQVMVALLVCDKASLEASLHDQLVCERVGGGAIFSKAEVLAGKHLPADDPLARLEIEHVFSHGRAGVANGIARFESGQTWSFCAMYEFATLKATSIKSIKIYLIEAR